MAPTRFVREFVRQISQRGAGAWSVPLSLYGAAALRRGALKPVVEESLRRTDLAAHIRFQMIRWARAVVDDSPLPPTFRPGQQIHDKDARNAASAALRERMRHGDSHQVAMQLVALDDGMSRARLLEIVENDLTASIAERAHRPKRGTGVDPTQLTSLVQDINARLGAVGISPFLMSGTLLGFIRNGTFLEHDHDVDLGLLPDVNLADVEAALDGSDLELQAEIDDLWLLAVHESGLHIDFFRHELRDGLFWHQTKIHRWWNTPFELSRFEHDGLSWWIPEDPHRYLDENYGDWSRPVAFYDISFDTPNRRYVDSEIAIRHLYTTCSRALDEGDRWAAESAARELRDTFGIDVTEYFASTRLLEAPDPHAERMQELRHRD